MSPLENTKPSAAPGALTVRVGCDLVFKCAAPATVVLVIKPVRDIVRRSLEESIDFDEGLSAHEFNDSHGNILHRVELRPGLNRIRHDALVSVPPESDRSDRIGHLVPPAKLPPELLRYTLPSRYCDSDKLADFAWQHFGKLPQGAEQVRAISDWLHENIEYRFGSGRPDISASEIIGRRYGVCRDFAHCTVALSRALNIPARYVTGHLPDIGYTDPGTPMDFHAYAEVYLGGEWHTFDARYNVPRIGRVKIAHGLDAVDCAFATAYGSAQLESFYVWAYQVRAEEVSVGDPVDLSKRLDGTETIRFL